MNIYHLMMMFLVFTLFTVNSKASTWKKEVTNQTIDATLKFNDKVYLLTHKKKRQISLNPSNQINAVNSLQTLRTNYSITELNREGEVENSISFESTNLFKNAVISSTGELILLMQSRSPKGLKKINLKRFDLNLNLVQQSDFVLDTAVDFEKLVYEDNYLYLMGVEVDTKLLRLIKLSTTLSIKWDQQLKGYPADVEFLNESAYDIKVNQENIYVTFNTSKTIQVIGSPPVNANFSGVVARINREGDLDWAKKIQYTGTNYLASQVLNIAHANNDAIWVTGNVSPLCFEGCPKSVVYKMSLTGSIVSSRSLSPDFYNFINEGKALANGNLIFYGFSNDDVFGPPPSFSRSHLFVLDQNLNQLDHFISKPNQINSAQLGQGETVFEKVFGFENNSIVYSTDNFLLRTNLDDMGCSELEQQAVSTGSVAFPNTSNIYINMIRIESTNKVFSFAFNSNMNQLTLNDICFDAGNTRLGKERLDWTISPNPSTNNITLNILDWDKEATFNIFNIKGEQMMKGSLVEKSIDIHHLPNGIYYININSINKRYNTVKLVKQ